MADDLNEKALEAATAAFIAERDATMTCPRCGGVGHHHGFGEDGTDPDWCSICGGGGAVAAHEKDSEHVAAAIRAYLAAAPAPSAPEPEWVGKVRAVLEFYASPSERRHPFRRNPFKPDQPWPFATDVPDFYSELNFGDAATEALALLPAAPSPGDRT